nr:hypothetical protein ctg_00140 [Ostreid herpesvirus 1]WHP53391.1 hypothetical protein ctg_00156 [Ostreid herpesvirus 1]
MLNFHSDVITPIGATQDHLPCNFLRWVTWVSPLLIGWLGVNYSRWRMKGGRFGKKCGEGGVVVSFCMCYICGFNDIPHWGGGRQHTACLNEEERGGACDG